MSNRIVDQYERHAHDWAARRGSVIGPERKWIDRFLSGCEEGATVLDLGCGSGDPIARYLLQCRMRVTGVDSSLTLVTMCRERFPSAEWIHADMRSLDLQRGFDGVIAWDSFFHLTMAEQRAMFPVFARHLLPGGRLLFTSGTAEGEAIGEWLGEPLYHASLGEEEYRDLLARHGLDVLHYQADDAECGNHTVWIAGRHAETSRS